MKGEEKKFQKGEVLQARQSKVEVVDLPHGTMPFAARIILYPRQCLMPVTYMV
ncbi:MAG: hypothetical protein GX363_09255 [Clostridiales bacterium]|nr:hypothetical protein [Clostridiales bacterium]